MEEPKILSKETKYCTSCNSIVETGILFTYEINVRYIDELHTEATAITLSKCLNCEGPILSEGNYVSIEDNFWYNSNIQLYPNTENIALKNAPEIVIGPYKDALKCYKVQAYDPCVIMCRKGIEAICQDKGETNGVLFDKLKSLKNKGVLETTLYNWANELRMIGNDGAHSHGQVITQEDAKDSINFFDALITYLYHLVDQYDKLKLRRSPQASNSLRK